MRRQQYTLISIQNTFIICRADPPDLGEKKQLLREKTIKI